MDKTKLQMSFAVDKTFDSDQFLKLRFRVCHDGESPNRTYFTKATMEEANKSLEYIPILAHVYIDQDTGKPVIGSHDMHIEEDKLNEGETRIIYDEVPIGVIPSLADNNCVIEEYDGLNYTYVDGYVWRDYANYAEQLLEDAENNKISMEIDFATDALSYDVENDRYNISSYRYRGITCLNESLGTGMKNAAATTTNFSANDDIKSKMIVLMEELQKCLREYDKQDSEQKGGDNMDKFNELLAKYGKAAEDVTFDIEGLSDEEIEAKFVEAFESDNDDGADNSTDSNEGNTEDGSEGNPEGGSEGNEQFVLKYELSHDDIRSALYNLLDAFSEDGYCTCWIMEVYDDKFMYHDYAENKYYRQGYSKDGDTVSLDENRVEVFNEWLSQAEKDALDALKEKYSTLQAQYDELKAFKDNYDATELKAQKDAIFARDEYSILADDEAFKALVDDAEKYSVEELETKADVIFAKFVKTNGEYSAKGETKQSKTLAQNYNAKPSKKKLAYDGLFEKDE